MSDEKKNLDDKAKDAAKSAASAAKETRNKAADAAKEAGAKASEAASEAKEKVEEFASEAKEKAEEFASEAKEKAEEFASEAKEKANEFKDEAKKTADELKEGFKNTFGSDNPEAGKNVAIIAHITPIGWVIAYLMNNNNKTELGSFYLRQVLGLILFAVIFNFIPIVGWLLNIVIFFLAVLSLLNSFSGKTKLLPFVGSLFQDWFKSI